MKKNRLNPELKNYVEQNIIPLYRNFDRAHQTDHVNAVIGESLNLAQYYEADTNMVYAIAAFHDTGLQGGREMHHRLSGDIIRQDRFLNSMFAPDEIEIMAQAAEDHRASAGHPPRTIYGRIVAEADRLIDAHTIVRRTIQYGLSHYPQSDKREHYRRFVEHMKEKYAEGGYLKLWIPESDNATKLADFREILKDGKRTEELFEREWTACTGRE